MKRSSDMNIDEIAETSNKVFLVESQDLTLHPGKINREASMELTENISQMNKFLQVNTLNKIDLIGKQMKNLQEMMSEVLSEAELNNELNKASCNFVKKPGHIYHLYEKFSGERYFSLLSPEEWGNPPHKYIGTWRLESDYSWSDPNKSTRYDGIKFLNQFGLFDYQNNSNMAIQF